MRLPVLLAAAVAASAGAASPLAAHDWYSGLRSPSGMLCCNDRDCHPVDLRIGPATGREEIQVNGAWHPVDYDKVLPVFPPDGGAHACWTNTREGPRFRCIILPGLAALDPPAGDPAAAAAAGRALV